MNNILKNTQVVGQNAGSSVSGTKKVSVVFFAMQTNDNKLRGAIGEKVYFKLHGDYFARTRPGSITPSQEELAVNVRLKMRAMGKLAKAVKYATPYGFVSRPKGESSSNAFVRVNYGCCSVADGVVSVDYERLVFAEGSMMPPIVEVSYDEAGHALTFTADPVVDDIPGCLADDEVYAVVLETGYNQCKLVKLGTRGTSEPQQVALHPLWNQENVHVYVFAANAKHSDASTSVYTPVTTV